jgi:hypothetical protein
MYVVERCNDEDYVLSSRQRVETVLRGRRVDGKHNVRNKKQKNVFVN